MKDENLEIIKKHLTSLKQEKSGLADLNVTRGDRLWTFTLGLMAEKDLNRNITSSIKKDNDDNPIIIRDARKLSETPITEDVGQWDYAILLLSYINAYQVLCKINNVEPELLTNENQYHLLMTALHEISQQTSESAAIHAFHQGVGMVSLAWARESGNNDKIKAEKELDKAKNWVSMDHPSLAIATLTNIDNQTFIQLDEPVYQLTDEQKTEYDLCGKNKASEFSGPIWFMHLQDFEKELVLFYREKIIEGRVIPSQLRSSLIGIKNSYQQTVAVYDEKENEINPLTQSFHCGTAVYLDKNRESQDLIKRQDAEGEMHRITNLSLQQQLDIIKSQHPEKPSKTIMTTLNSEHGDDVLKKISQIKQVKKIFAGEKIIPFIGDDKPIVHYTREAAKENNEHGIYASNICLNHYRKLFKNNYAGNQAIVKNAGEIFRCIYGNTNSVKLSSKKIPSIDKNNEGINLELHDLLIQLLDNIKRNIQLMKKGTVLSMDLQNRGLDIIQLSTEICFLNNKIIDIIGDKYNNHKHHVSYIEQWFGCASGENRTGYGEFHIATRAVNDYLKKNQCQADIQATQETFARAGHVSRMTGLSTMGTEGIRAKSAGTAPRHYSKKTQQYLISKPSDAKSVQDVKLTGKKHDYEFKTFQHFQKSKRRIPQKISIVPVTGDPQKENKELLNAKVINKLKELQETEPSQILQHKKDSNEHYLLSMNNQSMAIYSDKIVASTAYYGQSADIISLNNEVISAQIGHHNNDIDSLAAAAKPLIEKGLAIEIIAVGDNAKNPLPTLALLMEKLEPNIAEHLQENYQKHHNQLPAHLQLDTGSMSQPRSGK